jgi:NAD(P)-dependent dehydrogenase (short-subunit alcohol dehydrogenase family)
MAKWTDHDIPDLSEKIVVVTGGNSGLGFETCRMLAARSAQVILACRNEKKGNQAKAKIIEEFPFAEVSVEKFDLSNLESVRKFADRIHKSCAKLDLLCNNAGVMALPFRLTKDGFEMQIGTNHFGHFALTGLLFDLLKKADQSRVVTVSSLMHNYGKIHFENLHWTDNYDAWAAYGQSKLANLLFAYEFHRRLKAQGIHVASLAAHPGYSATNLQLAGPRMSGKWLMEQLSGLANSLIAQSAYKGSLPQVRALTDPDAESGEYYGPDGLWEMAGDPVVVQSNKRSHNKGDAARLWELSERLTKVDYGI